MGEPYRTGSFATALLDPEAVAPDTIRHPFSGAAATRLAVYRNNVTVGLTEALRAIFPATADLVGSTTFATLARDFIRKSPPASPVLAEYGHDFPDFLQHSPLSQTLFFLADVARVERAVLTAFHAADCQTLAAETLTAIPPEKLGALRLAAHPAAALISLSSSAATIVKRFRSGTGLDGFDPSPRQTVLVTRPAFDVELDILEGGAIPFVTALLNRCPLAEALDAALEFDPDFAPSAGFSVMLSSGAFAAIAQEMHS
ncbi:DNA-binding domain-containing protein [Martelella sp. HB161492]|uniref:HvfC/BufC N-terminal domain-containing protein n=1 Tax=Martelella sp. HB161492 TaxID=2720726 RepID=UPI0015929A3B|nr:DNA-binding domain-containing protein [Martelella sp. HB161492]